MFLFNHGYTTQTPSATVETRGTIKSFSLYKRDNVSALQATGCYVLTFVQVTANVTGGR